MSKLSIKFDNRNQKVDNYECCPKGIILSFKIENMVPGVQYNCNLSNTGSGTAVFKPNNFNITGTQIVESFMVVGELKGSRVHVIKVTTTSFEQNNIIIDCGGPDNSLIGRASNLLIGNRYTYSFTPLDTREVGNLQFMPASGTLIATTESENINTLVQYTGRSRSVIAKLTVTDSYNNFSDSTLATLKCK
jgi:hypothetical protein